MSPNHCFQNRGFCFPFLCVCFCFFQHIPTSHATLQSYRPTSWFFFRPTEPLRCPSGQCYQLTQWPGVSAPTASPGRCSPSSPYAASLCIMQTSWNMKHETSWNMKHETSWNMKHHANMNMNKSRKHGSIKKHEQTIKQIWKVCMILMLNANKF